MTAEEPVTTTNILKPNEPVATPWTYSLRERAFGKKVVGRVLKRERYKSIPSDSFGRYDLLTMLTEEGVKQVAVPSFFGGAGTRNPSSSEARVGQTLEMKLHGGIHKLFREPIAGKVAETATASTYDHVYDYGQFSFSASPRSDLKKEPTVFDQIASGLREVGAGLAASLSDGYKELKEEAVGMFGDTGNYFGRVASFVKDRGAALYNDEIGFGEFFVGKRVTGRVTDVEKYKSYAPCANYDTLTLRQDDGEQTTVHVPSWFSRNWQPSTRAAEKRSYVTMRTNGLLQTMFAEPLSGNVSGRTAAMYEHTRPTKGLFTRLKETLTAEIEMPGFVLAYN